MTAEEAEESGAIDPSKGAFLVLATFNSAPASAYTIRQVNLDTQTISTRPIKLNFGGDLSGRRLHPAPGTTNPGLTLLVASLEPGDYIVTELSHPTGS